MCVWYLDLHYDGSEFVVKLNVDDLEWCLFLSKCCNESVLAHMFMDEDE